MLIRKISSNQGSTISLYLGMYTGGMKLIGIIILSFIRWRPSECLEAKTRSLLIKLLLIWRAKFKTLPKLCLEPAKWDGSMPISLSRSPLSSLKFTSMASGSRCLVAGSSILRSFKIAEDKTKLDGLQVWGLKGLRWDCSKFPMSDFSGLKIQDSWINLRKERSLSSKSSANILDVLKTSQCGSLKTTIPMTYLDWSDKLEEI